MRGKNRGREEGERRGRGRGVPTHARMPYGGVPSRVAGATVRVGGWDGGGGWILDHTPHM